MTTQTTVVVIGAGPAGLAVSACLGIAGVDYVVLERAEKLAPKWRMHYERLHLHTYRDLSNLPFKKWSRGVPAYPSRRQVVGQLLSRLPARLADRLGVITSKLEFGDLTEHGITRPKLGPISQIRQLGRVPLIDVGTIDLIRRGEIRVVPGIERFHETGVTFVDGTKIDVDLVVLATGYRAAIDAFLEGSNRYLNERGYPKKLGAKAEPPGPYFVGFGNPPTGQLLEIREQARAVADKIAGTEGRTQ